MPNKQRKVLVVMGTRPEVIKLAPVITELSRHPARLKPLVCSTGQHRHILDQMMTMFKLKADFDLNLMKPNQALPEFLQHSVGELNKVIAKVRPDMTIVQGDTITATAAALASYYARVPVAHVEAGLRSHDRNNPFPEEANRLIVDQISDLLFVPTKSSARNLEKEGFPRSRVLITGNTVIDSLRQSLKFIDKKMDCCKIPKGKKLVLVTLHRRESFGKTLEGILKALKEVVETNKKLFMIYPVHPNPNVRGPAYKLLNHPRIKLIDPLSYLPFLSLMAKSDLIVTDSGGVQEEAPALNKPVLVLRDRTERSEAIFAGCAKLIGTDYGDIVREMKYSSERLCETCSAGANIYGDGLASRRITEAILHYFAPTKYPLPREFTRDIFLKDMAPPAETIFS
ncbi:MAG: UDP-N-acetylglucosamine 2-epimerase (non-hydrolyzing) [Elusimicrobia bacterium]|nr:UDP-N-acetylglucosamine 2-epimerase (non-hydrolyzing) [Elusimicrobiota bacterium]